MDVGVANGEVARSVGGLAIGGPAVGGLVERLVEGLDGDQVAAVLADEAVVAVLAGAGSGKTRVLTRRIARRIADGSAEGRHVLALTFTRKAAGELRHRLAALAGHRATSEGSPAVHTFHGFGGALLQRWWLDRGERPWDVTRNRRALLDAACAEVGARQLTAAALGAEIEWGKARLLDPDGYELAQLDDEREVDTAVVAATWRAYEADKGRRRVLDVDDFITLPVRLLAGEPDFARSRSWWHRHVFVDEAQDLNPAQLRLVSLVVGDEPDLCLVGDPDQAIYGWNGADPSLLVDLAASLPDRAVHRLPTNHRSTAPIVAAAASILGSPAGPVAGHGDDARWPVPAVAGHEDEVSEADAIAHRLQEARWRGARPWSSLAVLARTRVQLDVIAAALASRGIPHRLPGSLLDRPEVIAALQAVRAVDGGRGRPLRQLAGDLTDVCDQVLAAERTDADPEPGPAAEALHDLWVAHLDALVELVGEFCHAVPSGDLDSFRSWSRGVLGARGAEQGFDRRGVALTTLHRAKGLEWSVVVVAGCETGLLPHWRATSPAALAEERRLAYVGATRATEELHLTWARRRSTPLGERRSRRSPFLDDLEASVTPALTETTVQEGRLAGLRAARAALVPRAASGRRGPSPASPSHGPPSANREAELEAADGAGEDVGLDVELAASVETGDPPRQLLQEDA